MVSDDRSAFQALLCLLPSIYFFGKIVSPRFDSWFRAEAMMTLDEILRDIHALEEDIHNYERKYGVLSELFYESYSQGDEAPDDAWVLDWNMWAGMYEIYLRRRQQYRTHLHVLSNDQSSITNQESYRNLAGCALPVCLEH